MTMDDLFKDTGRDALWSGPDDAPGATGASARAPEIDTLQFMDWFGKSRVVDAVGDPMRVYHGTGADFTEFSTQGQGKTHGAGAFFTDNPKTADSYAGGTGGQVLPVYLSLQAPVVVDAGGANWNSIGQKARVELPRIEVSDVADEILVAELLGIPPNLNAKKVLRARKTSVRELFRGEWDYADDTASTDDIARWARAQGYDGVIIRNVRDRGPSGVFATEEAREPSTLYVAFRPEQVKSAIGNSGEFNPTRPDIRFSMPVKAAPQQVPFQEWFAGSRVVDAGGEPLPVFRGTQTGDGRNPRIFYTDNPKVASGYAVKRGATTHELRAGGDVYSFESRGEAEQARMGNGGRVVPVKNAPTVQKDVLAIRRPLVVDAQGAQWNRIRNPFASPQALADFEARIAQACMPLVLNGRPYSVAQQHADIEQEFYFQLFTDTDRLAKAAQEQGYDGLIVRNVYDVAVAGRVDETLKSSVFVVFSPDQARSAFEVPPKDKSSPFDRWFEGSVATDESGLPRVFYHGSSHTENLSTFDPAFTGKGNDQLGSGFYFTSQAKEAGYYAYDTDRRDASGEVVIKGGDSPGLTPVYLAVKNPIRVKGENLRNAEISITKEQAFKLICKAPGVRDLDNTPIGNWIDVWSKGKVTDDMIRQVASSYAGEFLMALESDFYSGHSTAFRHAAHEVLGVDGVLSEHEDGRQHIVAWFPTQIKSAIGNNGQYDPQNPDIRMSVAEVDAPKKVVPPSAFDRWFRGSAVVTSSGHPEVMYHGTGADFTEFDPERIGDTFRADERGFFFSNDPRLACVYAQSNSIGMPMEGGVVMPVYLAIKRPLVVNPAFLRSQGMASLDRLGEDVITFWDNYQSLILEWVDERGADGVIIEDPSVMIGREPTRMAVAMKPNQMKSAIGNSGRYSPLSNDIRHSLSEGVGDGEDLPLRYTPGGSGLYQAALERAFAHSRVTRRGRPMVVFHRTGADFTVFDTDRGDLGAHFGTAEQARALNNGNARPGENTMPVYLDIRNPIRLKDEGSFHADAVAPQLKRKGLIDGPTAKRLYEAGNRGNVQQRREANREIKRILREAGFDGVVYKNAHEGGGDSWIAFEPGQIKSAICNQGTFDTENPDVRMSLDDAPIRRERERG